MFVATEDVIYGCGEGGTPSDEQLKVCPNPDNKPPITPSEVQTNLALIMAKLGIKSCTRKDGTAYTPVGVFKNSSSVGCESIEVICKSYLEAKTAIVCLVNTVNQCSSNETVVNQNINIENIAPGQIICQCPANVNCTRQGLRVENLAKVRTVSSSQINQQMSSKVSDSIMDLIEALFDGVTAPDPTNPRAFPNNAPDGEKRIMDIQTDIQNYLDQRNWNQVVQQAVTSIFISQNIRLINTGLIVADQCIFSNNLISNLVADVVIMSSIDGVLGIPVLSTFLADMRAYDERNFPAPPPPPDSKPWVPWVIGVSVLAVVAIIVFLLRHKIKKVFNKKTKIKIN